MTLKTSPSADKTLAAYKKAIEKELQHFYVRDAMVYMGAEISVFGRQALTILQTFSSRPAKRLRGTLTSLAYDAVSGTHQAAVGIKAAVAVELMQDYLLIIDDVMDQSTVRRGGPSLQELYKRQGFDDHTAEMLAINVGLLAQHLSDLIIANIKTDQQSLVRVFKLMHRNIGLTGFGQMDDLRQNIGRRVSPEAILKAYQLKSSYYTFINPLQIGVALGGQADPKIFREIEHFGINAGLAFQLRDDILGLFGDPALTGKPVADDIKAGKSTLLIDYCLKNLAAADKQYIESRLGRGKISQPEIRRIQQIVAVSGARQYVEQQTAKYAARARAAINASNFWDLGTKGLLYGLVSFAEGRP